MADTTRTGREYLRVSKDKSGRQRSVDEQRDDNARHAAQRVTLGTPYAEPGAASASRYGRKPRGGFTRLLADLRTGRFGADELWLWESSRGSRKVGEWVQLVEALDAARVSVYVTTHGRLYDPTNPRDRRSLLEDAVDSEYESGKSSQRIRRAHAALAAAGKPNGKTPFGFRRVYDPATREGRQEIEPAEAPIVRELFTRIAAGDSLRSITRDFAARGIRSRTGKELTMQYLRKWLTRAAYAGLRTHKPEDGGPVTTTEAAWPALVDRALWRRVQDILSAPERKTRRPGRAYHLLSLLGRCDVCGDGLIATARTRTGVELWQYRCRLAGHVSVPYAELNRLAEKLMLDYLAREDVAAQLAAAAASTPELDAVREDLAKVRDDLGDLYAQSSAHRLSPGALAAIEPNYLAQIAELEARDRELSAPPALAGLITPGKGARRRWARLPVSARREVARILLSPDLVGELRVTRGRKGVQVPVEDRVTFRRAEA